MEAYKCEFIEFMVAADVLRFGDFTTKSGRRTPYFIDTGRYRSGAQLARLGEFYAAAIRAGVGDDFDVLFGPAYKGIPLVCTTALALWREHGQDVGYAFDRKEAKDHGEGGKLVGHRLQDGERVLIVEDVTTAGTSIRETVPLLRAAADVRLAGLVVSVDRMERGTRGTRGTGERSALAELAAEFEMPTFAIVTIEEVVAHLHGRELGGRVLIDDAMAASVRDYRAAYGV